MSNNPSDSPLAKLFVDAQALDKELLANTLYPFARIYEDHGKLQVGFTKEGDALTVRERLLIFFLARKALHLEKGADEAITPKDLEAETGISGGTIRPILKQLKDERLVVQVEGGYIARNHALQAINEILTKKGK